MYLTYGSSWSKIAKVVKGRTENSIKNRFYSTLRKIKSDGLRNDGKIITEDKNYELDGLAKSHLYLLLIKN